MHTSTCLGRPKAHSIPWYLFIFHWHSLPEPASVVCDFEQGDIFYSAGPHRISIRVMLHITISLIHFKCDVTDHCQSDSISFSVVLRGSPHQSLSVWLTDHPLPISVSVMLQISHHRSMSVWGYGSPIINLCHCDVIDHPSSVSVSVMLHIIHHQSLSVWCYRSAIISLCQCDVTDHPSSIYVSVMDQTNTKASNNSKNKPEKTRTFQFYFLPGVTLFTAVSWLRNEERELFTSAFRDLWAILDPPQERRRKQKQQLHAFDNYTHYA